MLTNSSPVFSGYFQACNDLAICASHYCCKSGIGRILQVLNACILWQQVLKILAPTHELNRHHRTLVFLHQMLLMESQHCPVFPCRLWRVHVYLGLSTQPKRDPSHIGLAMTLMSKFGTRKLANSFANFNHSQFEFISPSTLSQPQTLFSPLTILKFISWEFEGEHSSYEGTWRIVKIHHRLFRWIICLSTNRAVGAEWHLPRTRIACVIVDPAGSVIILTSVSVRT